MPTPLSLADIAKQAAARHATGFVEDGMKLGLGTGSTAAFMVAALGERIRNEGLQVTCVATSTRTAEQARQEGVTVVALDDAKWLDMTIDGADEVDPQLHLIKGGGAALLQEKIVATASDRMVVIADAAKLVPHLGAFPLPVEIVPFGWQTTKALIEELLVDLEVMNRDCVLRMKGDQPLITDERNFIVDLHLKWIGNPRQVALALNQIPGVVENGLFLDICDTLVIGHPDGRVDVRHADLGRAGLDDAQLYTTPNIFADLGD